MAELDSGLKDPGEEFRQPSRKKNIFWRQYVTMLRKDMLVMLRHKIILLLALFAPALLFLTICDNRFPAQRITTHYESKEYSQFDLKVRPIAYYPSDSPATIEWIRAMASMYDYEPSSAQIIAYKSEDELKDKVLECPDCFWASFTFEEINPAQLIYKYSWRVHPQFILDQETGKDSERLYDPIIAENMAEYATVKYLASNQHVKVIRDNKIENVTAKIHLRKFPDIPYYDPIDIYNKIGSGAPVVLALGCLTSLLSFTLNIVSDKQHKLRQSLHTVGLRDSVFWLSLFTVAVVLSFTQALILNVIADISGYIYFKNSAPVLNFFIIWLTFLASHTFSFLVGALIANVKVLIIAIVAFVIINFLVGSLCTDHKKIYPEMGNPSGWQLIFLTHAAQALYLISLKAIPYIDKYYPSEPQKFTWRDSASFTGVCGDWSCDPSGYDCGHTVAFCIAMLLVFVFVHLLLAAYIDLVLPYAHGARFRLYEPFTPEFWGFTKQAPPPPSHIPQYQPKPPLQSWDADVKMEAMKVLAPLGSAEFKTVQDSAIIIYDLNVKFSKPCSKRAKHAVNSLSLALERNTVLGLLGANGAGKTTTMSIITGQLRPTSGYVQVEGYSCQHQRRQVAEHLGYAPQFDVLWPDLSPAEHIRIFADLRGLDYGSEIQSIRNAYMAAERAGIAPMINEDEDELAENAETVENEEKPLIKPRQSKKQLLDQLIRMRLRDVGLSDKMRTPSKSLSGGMKRRLTLCLALVGNPPILLLDEVSTGLDPISRRKIWDVILRSKTDRSVLLTTHSMEEADTLSDRIAIMAFGVLRCVGKSDRLKRKYGMGYRVDVQCEFDPIRGVSDVLRVRDELVMPYMREALLVGRTGGHLTLAVPRSVDMRTLQDFLRKLEEKVDIVKKWGIRQTTLEEVFLAISRHAERVEAVRNIMDQ